MRRLVVVGALTTGLVLAALPATASDDLDELFERASQAEFSGTKFVHCQTPDGVVSQMTDIKQSGGVAVIKARTSDTEVIARKGEYADRAGDYSRVATVSGGGVTDPTVRYEVEIAGVDRVLDRRITAVQIREGEMVRVLLGFDASSGAVLRTETFNAAGTSYCTSEFVAFMPGMPEMELISMEEAERTQLVAYGGELDSDRLPAAVGGFSRIDVYSGTEGTMVAYYSDGFFSLSVMSSGSRLEIPELSGVEAAQIDGGSYQRKFFPGQVIYVWETPKGGYAMVSDAPVDMQLAVLADLPRPGKPFFLTRWWRALLGG
ncbi:MAG: hypothetical protein ACE5MI_05775 [Acidimicrobiia bacterium]